MSQESNADTITKPNKIWTVAWPSIGFLGCFALLSTTIIANDISHLTTLIKSFGHFLFLGVTGAVFANSTGAGGGVIFIPAFTHLGLSEAQSVSTSFAIQCFGMTAGSLTWCWYYQKQHKLTSQWRSFIPLTLTGGFSAIAGLWTSYALTLPLPASLHVSFSLFSIFLGIIIVYSSLKNQTTKDIQLNNLDLPVFFILGFLGGIMTSWLSVGVGELLVIYLMLRGFCAKMAIAVGVVVSAMTVWSASPVHLSPDSQTQFYILLFAAPGAIIGGLLARKLALYLSVLKLKLFFSCWIILTGMAMLAN
ncbi:sulfite exporter TauE/SafE family protein [Shewanella sp. AS1]|uniref:sulfite exporter TauE/SafE family protein n=1 Tax=Shewanella sp. AS1 TaxID=2907626 RepID=UPI001F23C044|nr:sulfite exporter TauE/SafE family protein [Shewanella sp. AS1]MCE9678024.1 sulfite exporter TauE/SafE family protein [Shewanella sp. AS1]